jgi:hydrogenase maturation protease
MDNRKPTSDLTSTSPRILVAGIGNIFLGDDGFGVEVALRLAQRPQPDGVRVRDFGIRGLDLTYALAEECDVAILIDAVPRGKPPGTLFVIEPGPAEMAAPAPLDPSDPAGFTPMIDGHGMDPAKVLRLVGAIGGKLQHVLVVGCEPTPFDPEIDMDMSLSAPVQAAVDEAVALVESLVQKIGAGQYGSWATSPRDSFAADASPKGEVGHGHLQSLQ